MSKWATPPAILPCRIRESFIRPTRPRGKTSRVKSQPRAPQMLDAVIVSDVHLGSGNCQAKHLGELLGRIAEGELATSRLILNGDVFDSIDFRRLQKSHWRILSLHRKLSDHVEIVWLAGNHDGSAEIISHLLGVTVEDEYVLESGAHRLLVLHGHVFDDFIQTYPR